jgi:hypothetical protein
MTCPYVTAALSLAEAALSADPSNHLVVPSGCDAMRRCGDLLGQAFGDRVYPLAVPRAGGDAAARSFARALADLQVWVERLGRGAPEKSSHRPHEVASPGRYTPNGVFLVAGPLDDDALLRLVGDLGLPLSGLDSCSSVERSAELDSAERAGSVTELAERLLSEVVCPRRPAGERRAHLSQRFAIARPAAVVYARQSFCDPAAYDALGVGRLAAEQDLPFLEIEVGLPVEVTGALRTRVEAFLETLLEL